MKGAQVTVAGCHGGCGTSMVSAHLAVGLATLTRQPVLLVDMAGPARVQEMLLGVQMSASASIEPWQHPELLRGYLPAHASGAEVLSLAPWWSGHDDRWVAYVELCRGAYPWVVVDIGFQFPPGLTNILEGSVVNWLVATPDPLGIGGWQAWKRLVETSHLPYEMMSVVVNKSGWPQGLDPDQMKALWPQPPRAILPYDADGAGRAVKTGKLLVGHAVQGALGRSLHQLCVRVEEAGRRRQDDHGADGRESDPSLRESELKRRVHGRLVDELKAKYPGLDLTSNVAGHAELRNHARTAIEQIFSEEAGSLKERDRRTRLIQEIVDEALGLGPLETLMRDPGVTEIMVNGREHVFIERNGKLESVPCKFETDQHLLSIIERIVVPIGRRIDESVPLVDARLPDGSRVNAVIPPLALNGPTLTIRKFSKQKLTVDDLIQKGSFSREVAEWFRQAVQGRKNIVVSGGTGSGKTTLLNVLSAYIPSDERIVTIEDAAELRLDQPHVVRLETRPPNLEGKGAIVIRDLVKNALRMRPDRIIVGECRGGEALDMLQAMNTGHDGSLTTVHANTPKDALTRIETMVLMAGMDLPLKAIREQVVSAVHLVIQTSRSEDGRRMVTHVSEVDGWEGDRIRLKELMGTRAQG